IPLTEEKRLIAMVNLLDITAREIDNRKDVSLNRKLNRQAETFLFKDGAIYSYVERGEEESISRIFSLIEDVKDLDPKIVQTIRLAITKRFPDFKFYGGAEPQITSVSRGG